MLGLKKEEEIFIPCHLEKNDQGDESYHFKY
jgi:hypothetical protein